MKRLTLISLATALAVSFAYAGWWQTFGGTERDEGTCVQQTSDGGYIVTGYTYSFSAIPGKAEIWLIKLDSLGDTEWTKTYGEGGGYSVRRTSDGGYIIAGSKLIKTDSTGDTLWTRSNGGNSVQQTNDGGYILTGGGLKLTKLNENGDSIWTQVYQKGNYADAGAYVEQTTDSGYIVVGLSGNVDPEMGYKSSIWLLKTDANGDTLWTCMYGGELWEVNYDRGNCVKQTSDGGYVIAGTLIEDYKLYSLIKTDAEGNILWKSIRGGECHCVEELPEGGYIVTGGTEWGTLLSDSPDGNLWLLKTTDNGDTVWTRQYGGDGTDAGRYVQPTTDGGYITVGYTTSFGAGDYDLYLLKTDSLGLLSVEESFVNDHLKNWEVVKPVGRQILLRYSDCPNGFVASIFDVSGRQISKLQAYSSSGILSWGQGYTPGVYFIQVKGQNSTSTAKVVLVR